MHYLTRHRRGKRLGLTALALLFALGLGTTFGADSGPRHHAQGEYDSAAAVYLVVEGDDLIAISERFSVSVGDLKGHNKLASDEIEVG
jgi:hypothetical protein